MNVFDLSLPILGVHVAKMFSFMLKKRHNKKNAEVKLTK
jgi:hypothetical protein